MAKIQELTMALLNVIKWDALPGIAAYRYPAEKIRLGSQLFVSETQNVVLLKSGRLIKTFGPGRHTLATGNIPLLDALVDLPFGGETPFPVELWFVNKTVKLDIPWQTGAPIPLRDPQFGVVTPLRGEGQFGLAVEDAAKFMVKLVGTLHSFDHETLRLYFKGIVLTRTSTLVAGFVSERRIPVLQIAPHLAELSEIVNAALHEEFADYGLSVSKFRITALTPDPSPGLEQVSQALADKAQMEILGISYREKKELEIMEKAAMNQAGMTGGMVGAGVGLGIGQKLAEKVGSFGGGTLTCPHCGKVCKDIYTYCPKCGKTIK